MCSAKLDPFQFIRRMRKRERSVSLRARFEEFKPEGRGTRWNREDLQFSGESRAVRAKRKYYAATSRNMPLTLVECVSPLASKIDPETEVCATCQGNCIIDVDVSRAPRQLASYRDGERVFPRREGKFHESMKARLAPDAGTAFFRKANFQLLPRYRATRDEDQLGHARNVSRSILISRVASENH